MDREQRKYSQVKESQDGAGKERSPFREYDLSHSTIRVDVLTSGIPSKKRRSHECGNAADVKVREIRSIRKGSILGV